MTDSRVTNERDVKWSGLGDADKTTSYAGIDLTAHPAIREAYRIACLIEWCGASEALTRASSAAFDFVATVNQLAAEAKLGDISFKGLCAHNDEVQRLQLALTAAESRIAELEARYEAPPKLVPVMPPELFRWRHAAKAQACMMVRERTGCSLRDAMHSLREADYG